MERLIRCRPLTSDPEAVNRATALVADVVSSAGLYTSEERVGGRRVLYAATRETHTPAVLLNVHLDVVPGDPGQFEPVEEAGWLAARGSHDCLGNAALAVQALLRAGPEVDCGAVFSSDEETGGDTTKRMVEAGYGARRLVLVMDGGGYALIIGQKGVLVVTLTASGEACHAAEPWKGRNAIDRLVDGYARIRELFPSVEPPDEWRDTLAATGMKAGTAANRVPDRAEMTVNIRYTEDTDAEQLLERIADVSGLAVETGLRCPPVFFEQDTPIFQTLRRCMESTLDHPVKITRLNGATDARHFVPTGVPVAIIGVPGRDPHGRGEAVSLEGLGTYEEMLVEFLHSVARE